MVSEAISKLENQLAESSRQFMIFEDDEVFELIEFNDNNEE